MKSDTKDPSNNEVPKKNPDASSYPSAPHEAVEKSSEAELVKQLTSVTLTAPREISDMSVSKPAKKSKEDYKFWKTQPVPDLGNGLEFL